MENINLKFEAVITKEDDIYCSFCIDLDVASEGLTENNIGREVDIIYKNDFIFS